jgi:hypothetical protein
MKQKYEVGQNVYTAKNLRGWFDYSMKEYIPENTPCTVTGVYFDWDHKEPRYCVKFLDQVKEFGLQFLLESSLKLG